MDALTKAAIGEPVELRGSIVATGRIAALTGQAATVEWIAGGRHRHLATALSALRRDEGGALVLHLSWPDGQALRIGSRIVRQAAPPDAAFSPAQCRAARELLGWTRARLSGFANVSDTVIVQFEAGRARPGAGLIAALRGALEAAGIEFTAEAPGGVRLGPDLGDVGSPTRRSHGRGIRRPYVGLPASQARASPR